MKSKLILGGISALVLSLGAQAQPGMGGMGPMRTQERDCGKARDPQRCAAFEKAKEACKESTGPAKKQCLQEAMPPVDCAKTRNPERCEAHRKAKELCKDKIGPDHRQCMRENTPKRQAPAPSKN